MPDIFCPTTPREESTNVTTPAPDAAATGHLEVRLSDDHRIAQLFPGFPEKDQPERWLCMTAPGGLLTATLLSDEDVAGWRVVWPDQQGPGRM